MANFNRYITAAEVLNGAAVESGLSPSADPYSSTDPAFVQLLYLLNGVGRELLAMRAWQQLVKETTLTIPYSGAESYALPSDFDRFVDQTAWDRGVAAPVYGFFSPQQWQAAKGADVGVSTQSVSFRFSQDLIYVYPTPPAGIGTYATINYEYVSRGWSQIAATSPVEYRDYVGAGSDILLFDPVLMVKALKLRFLGAKGFNTTDIARQVETAYRNAVSKSVAGSVLSVAPGQRAEEFLIYGSIG